MFRYVFGGAVARYRARRLRRLPDAGDLRADGRLRRPEHRRRAGRGSRQGPRRAVPVAADGPLGGARRAHLGRRRPQRLRRAADDRRRVPRRLRHLRRRGWRSAAIVLLLLFGFAMSWVFALVALSVPNAEAAQAASFPILALLVFASNAFVPVETMPGWLQAYNEVQPGLDRRRRRAGALSRRRDAASRCSRHSPASPGSSTCSSRSPSTSTAGRCSPSPPPSCISILRAPAR